jgi:signal transduction histidine kinase
LLKDRAVLCVRDYGQGIPRETLERFLHDGTHVGVGLAGMRERVAEQNGRFEILSDESGTAIEVGMPLLADDNTEDGQAAALPRS